MSRLVNYTFGDLCDRLSILTLKLFHYKIAGKPTDHLRDERNVLLTQWQARSPTGKWFEHMLELGVINGELWRQTDALRICLEDSRELEVSGQIGLSILTLNDRRAQLVDLIDQEVGDHKGREKG